MHRGTKLFLGIAAEGLKLYYKMDDSKVSEILGPVPKIPSSKLNGVKNAFGFPIKINDEDVPFYVCLTYVAGSLILGKMPDELALMVGEDKEKAINMYKEGLKWISKLIYAITRLTNYAKDDTVKEVGARLIADSIWASLMIYYATSSGNSVYGLLKNVSKEIYQFPTDKDAEELKKEIELLMNGNHLERVMDGVPIPPDKSKKEELHEDKKIEKADEALEALRALQRQLIYTSRMAKHIQASAQKIIQK